MEKNKRIKSSEADTYIYIFICDVLSIIMYVYISTYVCIHKYINLIYERGSILNHWENKSLFVKKLSIRLNFYSTPYTREISDVLKN